MSSITPKTVYNFNGKDYDSLSEIETAIENGIGSIVDQLDKNIHFGTKHKQAVLDLIMANHATLALYSSHLDDLEDVERAIIEGD